MKPLFFSKVSSTMGYGTQVSDICLKSIYPPFNYPLSDRPRFNNLNKGNRYKRSLDLLHINNAIEKIDYLKQYSSVSSFLTIPSLWNTDINILPFINYITKTQLLQSLPENYYPDLSGIPHIKIQKGHKALKHHIIHLYNSISYEDTNKKESNIQQLISSLLRICKALTADLNTQILHMIEDIDTELNFTWFRGGYEKIKGYPLRAFWANENSFGYHYKNLLNNYYRMQYPLINVCALDSDLSNGNIESVLYYPANYGLMPIKMPYSCDSGFLVQHDYRYYLAFPAMSAVGRKAEAQRLKEENWAKNGHLKPRALFPFISTRSCHALNRPPGVPIISGDRRSSHFAERRPEVGDKVKANAMVDAFAWTNALSNYLGFTPFNDLTYPIVTQSICTDGKFWDFFTYQLNTTNLWMEPLPPRAMKKEEGDDVDDFENLLRAKDSLPTKNTRINLCWNLADVKLFDSVENNEVVGYNPQVLETCLKFFLNVPIQKSESELMPYVNPSQETIDNYKFVC